MQFIVLALILIATNSWADSVSKVDSKTVQVTKPAPVETIKFDEAQAKVDRLKQAKSNADASSLQYQAEIDALLGAFSAAGLNWTNLEVLKKQGK